MHKKEKRLSLIKSEETAKAMKLIDPTIELVSCGSSFRDMPTFPQWEATTLEHNYDYVDYISLHQYYGNLNQDSSDYLAQLVNVIAPIMTERDGGAWRQTIFYPFYHASRYGRGMVLGTAADAPVHETSTHGEVSDLVSTAVWNQEEETLTVFAVNRNLEEDCRLELDLRSFEKCVPVEKLELAGFGLKEENTASEEKVRPQSLTDIRMENGKAETVLKKASWNVLRFHL